MRPHLAALPLLAASLCAQTTHLVGPNGLPQIRDAIAIAAPGDVVVVEPGTYAHFLCDVGVTIRAQVPGTVTVELDTSFLPPGCISDLTCVYVSGPTRFVPPSDQAVHVAGLRFAPNTIWLGFFTLRHRVQVESGTVTFDDCWIHAQDTTALSTLNATVHVQDCLVAGTGGASMASGMIANASHVTAAGSLFGGNGVLGLVFPGDGARLVNSTLKASNCGFGGGTAAVGGPGGHAIVTDGLSRLWISDSTLTAGAGECAIDGTPAIGQIARSTVTQSAIGCTALTNAPLVGVERATPIHNGGPFSVFVKTEPFQLVAIHASPRLAHYEIPGFAQPIALDLTSFFLAGVYVSDGNGDVTATWNMPAGQYVDETIWLETIVLPPASEILVGPAVGGVIR